MTAVAMGLTVMWSNTANFEVVHYISRRVLQGLWSIQTVCISASVIGCDSESALVAYISDAMLHYSL